LVEKCSNQQKITRDVDFRAPGGHESLWTTGKNIEFLRVRCEVSKQPNLDFSFCGLLPSLWLKFHPHLIFLGLESWPPSNRKVPFHMDCLFLWSHISRFSQHQTERFFHKNKRNILQTCNFFKSVWIWPQKFQLWMKLELKKNPDLVVSGFGTSQWTSENTIFSPVVQRDSRPPQMLENQCLWPFFAVLNLS
jgi:hypothetical protein